MNAELELDEHELTPVFSTRQIRTHLGADPAQPVASYRETLNWGGEQLYKLFHEGAPAEALVHARADLVDEVLRTAWLRFLPDATPDLCLIAVGGYGRKELLPHSDIDLLLLDTPHTLADNKRALERFFAFLWDIGLEVGSSVRSVEECVKLAAEDITVITNLLEARPLCGDNLLFDTLSTALTPDKLWSVQAFYRAKLEEQRQRHRKYDDTGYKLEPNVKESPGGLRDIHTVAWVAKRHFGALTLTELRDRGFLNKAECSELLAAQDFLWRTRFALHMITGRHEDRLLFDHQIEVAELFGYVDSDHNRAVEQFMQLYYRSIKSLSCLNDMLLQLFDEAILHKDENLPTRVLNARFQVRGNVIEARDDEVFRRQPQALLEIFALMQKTPDVDGIRAWTLRLIRRDLRLMDDAVRRDRHSRQLFIGLFRHGDGLTTTLRRMNRYGVLGAYMPQFERIVGHMQYDLFHTLTVDEHSLRLVRNLRRMAMPQFADELPFASEIFKRVPRPELLYIAGLMHDLAKGRGGDHSELGAVDAHRFCLDHGLTNADAALVAWLVRQHLTLSLTAQRQDISNPEIVTAFARIVGDRQRLDYLFLLTVADIRATNPALWNAWRESLLKTLYHNAARALERGLDNPVSERERVAEQHRATLALLDDSDSNIDTARIEAICARFETDYFLRHTPRELAWHLEAIAQVRISDLPLILTDTLDDQGTTVFIYMRNRDHLFALTAGVLARLGLTILDARINTTGDGYTLDSWVVMESDGLTGNNPHRNAEIGDALRKVLSDPDLRSVRVNCRPPSQLKHFDTPTTVYFSQDRVHGCTVLELVAADRPGLLALVGRVFGKHRIHIDAAKIGTIGERAEDAFFITDEQRHPIEDPKMLKRLRDELTRVLDRDNHTTSKVD